jgi:tRNA-splicing ligase RtcB
MTIELRGKYTSCKIFNDEVEEEAIKQIYEFLNHPAFENLKIRIQSDVHYGSGAVIGFTSSLGSKIIPNVIGVDINCGVLCYNIGKLDINFQELDTFIRENIPYGTRIRSKIAQRHITDKAYSVIRKKGYPEKSGELIQQIKDVCEATKQDQNYVLNSLGSLGGGNHFIELNQGVTGDIYLTIHSGSRNFGLKIAQWHQKIAKGLNPHGDLSYLEGEEAQAYINHSKVVGMYAVLNRELMAQYILEYLKIRNPIQRIESVHNYIDFDAGIIRKGSISAQKDEYVIIPWNMRDGSVLGVGQGNEDYNYSAPHGAGRKMGRNVAKKTLDLEEFKETMEGVWSSCINKGTLDEAPMAYKDSATIESLLEPTVKVIDKIKPIYNFKASEDERDIDKEKLSDS